jgi:hypothetical protein
MSPWAATGGDAHPYLDEPRRDMISGASSVISFIGVTLALFAYGIPPGARANESCRLDPGAGGLVEISKKRSQICR